MSLSTTANSARDTSSSQALYPTAALDSVLALVVSQALNRLRALARVRAPIPAKAKALALTLLAMPLIVLADARETQTFEVGRYAFEVSLPPGYRVELLSSDLELPRIIHLAGNQVLIGTRSGKVYALDPPYTNARVLVTLDNYPHSVVVHNGFLYVARTSGVYKAPYESSTQTLAKDDFEKVISLPGGGGHNSRTLKAGPDNALYVSLGISGNCSNQYLHTRWPFEARRGGVFRIDALHTSQPTLTPYASGLRNPIGMDWHPETETLYATNNGPDHLGFDMPGEYFARLEADSNHGMPWFQYDGEKLTRDTCIDSEPPFDVSDVSAPVARFPARSAPMDMAFLNERTGDGSLANDALVALHGSWATDDGGGSGDPASRREPKLVRVDFSDKDALVVSDFMSGFQLEDGTRWARPMGVAVAPDGSILFTSDDGIHGLYRVTYTPP